LRIRSALEDSFEDVELGSGECVVYVGFVDDPHPPFGEVVGDRVVEGSADSS